MRTLLLFLCTSLVVLPAFSQSATHIRANVPFSFEVAGITLPAGEYRIPDPGNSAVKVQNAEGKPAAFAIGIPQRGNSQRNIELVFNKYGDRYFLSRISHSHMVYQLTKSKAERELVTSRLVTAAAPERVTIAARIAR